MNKVMLILSLICIVFAIVGCEGNKSIANNEISHLKSDDISSIDIIAIENQAIPISESSLIIQFVQAITTAEYTNGQLDIKAPDYKATLYLKNGTQQKLSFWIEGNSRGLIAKDGQVGHYLLQDEAKQKLQSLFQMAYADTKTPLKLQAGDIKSIIIMKPDSHDIEQAKNRLGVIENEKDINEFYNAIHNNAELARGDIISIGANLDFVIEYNSSKQHLSYWNHPNLKMIEDHETNIIYFLSNEAIEQINMILHTANVLID